MNADAPRKPLVVVALGAAEREDFAIELARAIARSEAPELLGLYVENDELLAVAGSRRAREILLTGGERALDRARLERQLRQRAARTRIRFEAITARLGLSHRFEIARGDLYSESIKRAAAAEALVVSLAHVLGSGVSLASLLHQLVAARLPRVLLARQGWLTGRTVAVVIDDLTTAAEAALTTAARIAAASRSPMAVLVLVSSTPDAGRLKHEIVARLERLAAGPSHVIELASADVGGIVHATRACRARLLVMPSPADEADSAAIAELLGRYSGALMLVRSGEPGELGRPGDTGETDGGSRGA